MLRAGHRMKVVSELLGHSDVSITLQTYDHVESDTLCVVKSCETSLAAGPSYGLSFSSTLGFWFQRPRL
jgi:hypothetical protein